MRKRRVIIGLRQGLKKYFARVNEIPGEERIFNDEF